MWTTTILIAWVEGVCPCRTHTPDGVPPSRGGGRGGGGVDINSNGRMVTRLALALTPLQYFAPRVQ